MIVSPSFSSLLVRKPTSPLLSPATSPMYSPTSTFPYLPESHFPSYSFYGTPRSPPLYHRDSRGMESSRSEPFFDYPEERLSPQSFFDFRQPPMVAGVDPIVEFPMYPRSSYFGPRSESSGFSGPPRNRRDPRSYTRDPSGFYSHPPIQDRLSQTQDTSFNCKPTSCLDDSGQVNTTIDKNNFPFAVSARYLFVWCGCII